MESTQYGQLVIKIEAFAARHPEEKAKMDEILWGINILFKDMVQKGNVTTQEAVMKEIEHQECKQKKEVVEEMMQLIHRLYSDTVQQTNEAVPVQKFNTKKNEYQVVYNQNIAISADAQNQSAVGEEVIMAEMGGCAKNMTLKKKNQKKESKKKNKVVIWHRGRKMADMCAHAVLEVIATFGGVPLIGHWEFPDGVWKKGVRKKRKQQEEN